MLTNIEIKNLLSKRRGDFEKFCKFLNVSREVLYYRLKSEDKKNNLSGMYIEFLLKDLMEKKK